MDFDELTERLWREAEAVPRNQKDEFYLANDFRVRVIALCKMVECEAAREQLERDCAIVCDMCLSPKKAEIGVICGPATYYPDSHEWGHTRTPADPAVGALYPTRCRANYFRKEFARLHPEVGQ